MKTLHSIKYSLFKGYNDQEQKIINVYRHKIIQYGKFTQVHDYFKFKLTFSSKRTTGKRDILKPKTDYSFARTQQKVFQIIEANHRQHGPFKPVFATLTFADQYHERKKTDRLVALFIKRLNRYVGHKIMYIFVPERHQSGAIHYHGVFFNLPFIPIKILSEQIYGYGYIDVQIPKKLKSITGYISKYITKDVFKMIDKQKKSYLIPKGLIHPVTRFDFFEPTDRMVIINKKYLPHSLVIKYAEV